MQNQVLLFATGTPAGGATGARSVVEALHLQPGKGIAVCGIVSNIAGGGAEKLAEEYDIPFFHHTGGYTAADYHATFERFAAFDPERDLVVLCGWNKIIRGHVPYRTINPHPGPRPATNGLYDRAIYEWLITARYLQSSLNIHYATAEIDKGPTLFSKRITIDADDTPELLRTRTQQIEHRWLPHVIEMIFSGEMGWDGRDPDDYPESVWGSITT
ncbi:MAG TPA: formyltransferase family protein [Candidatus Paceibacterota bacterium]|nr:formyltransferase family protein [Candidatus Paceibacterota bacterium]